MSVKNNLLKICLMVILILPSGVFAKESIGDYVLEFDEKIESDTDGNGKNDRTSYYMGDVLVWSAFDDDEDGEPDLWLRYKNGDTVDLQISDSDGDGNPDKIAEMDYSGKREVIYDIDANFAVSGSSWFSKIIWAFVVLVGGFAGYRFWKKRSGREE